MNPDVRPTRLCGGDDLAAFVDAHDVALVEFYTEGCGACQAMEPVLGNVARVTDVAVGLLNPGDDLALLDEFDVRSVPTLLLFRDGELVATRAEGFQGTAAVVDFVEEGVPTADRATG
jgi:thiol-disulfide isomerase/thioredoxin